ncbi:FadR/GntR family transcriptional regulator [Gilvimarinus sp. SDUM040013]|uniref:FadR/GntR family transcriptional regulator n=1 Tax=Gilvimarinus gilvus TaxID=3058038 RepID=A0ABU4S0T0_9GAMM|nr:FadR/GntR family transcriptional regulator [Gilvimarinus sp. SDUM040013]MDO3387730.1 FadR/GntR family transcriptional regulator [Gilvimarinus sp. SDUM040013]MDX6848829.1 FadR/GntR family transcriptional regulator [Gilvimarinus sp. SDUM040013]
MNNFEGSRNLTQQVVYELGLSIVQGKYSGVDVFPTEAQLSAHFQISRSVIREAVKMLTAKGLINSRPRQGIRVQPTACWNVFDSDVLNWILQGRPSLSLLQEFTELRSGVEPEAAMLAASRQNAAEIGAIERGLERLKRAGDGLDDPLAADIEFHTAVLLASGNRFYIQLTSFIQTALQASISCTNQLKGISAGSYRDHKRIYDAICEGNSEAAGAAMRELLSEALGLISESNSPQKTGVIAQAS